MNQIEVNNFQTPKPKVAKKRVVDCKDNSLTPISIPPSPCMKHLGYGTGINVYLIERFSPLRGCYRSPWAVKKINSKLQSNPEFKLRLEEETVILKSLNHPNIIGYRTSVKGVDGNPCLLMESGQISLSDLIEERADKGLGPFHVEEIMKVSKSVASALHYLHEKCHLLHGDLKSSNVLIKDNFEAIKLCDFGVTLRLDKQLMVDSTKEFYIGTECWSAPEVIKCEQISNKSDIFSYGLIIWEMLALTAPHLDKLNFEEDSVNSMEYSEESPLDQTNSGKDFAVDEKLQEQMEHNYREALGTRPALPVLKEEYNKVLEIFYVCTETDPEKRPSAIHILTAFFS